MDSEGFASTPWAEMYVDGVGKGVSRPAPLNGVISVGSCDPEVRKRRTTISCLSCMLITTNSALMQSGYRNVTLLGLGSDRTTVVGRHTLLKPGVAVRLELVLDVPSISTGTGSALYLDGTYADLPH